MIFCRFSRFWKDPNFWLKRYGFKDFFFGRLGFVGCISFTNFFPYSEKSGKKYFPRKKLHVQVWRSRLHIFGNKGRKEKTKEWRAEKKMFIYLFEPLNFMWRKLEACSSLRNRVNSSWYERALVLFNPQKSLWGSLINF